jgi:2-aminoethylphosphonate dioxygenase
MAGNWMPITPTRIAALSDGKPASADREQLQHDGFLRVGGLVTAAAVEQLLRWTTELESGPEVSGQHWIYREESLSAPGLKVIQRIENFCPTHVGFDRFVRSGLIADWTSALMGGPVVLFKDKINFKMPGGAGFKLHQDQQAGWDRYAPRFMTAMVSLDAATPANGCLQFAVGRHREGLLGEPWKPLDEVDVALTAVPTAPGEVIFFDSYLPHASKANFTARPRRILYLTYNLARQGDQRARYYADKFAAFPPDVDRDPTKTYVFRV